MINILCKFGIHEYETTTTYYPSSLHDTFNLAVVHDTQCIKCGDKIDRWSDFVFKDAFGEEAHEHAVKVLQDEGYDLEPYFEWLNGR